MLSVSNLNKSYGPAIVLNSVTFNLNKGLRAGLVGANGSGKSTLLKIMAGRETADSGKITQETSLTTGYLPQNLPPSSGQTIQSLILKSTGELTQLEARMRKLEQSIEAASGNQLTALMEEYSAVSMQFQSAGGYEMDYRIKAVLDGLGIGYLDREREIETLSGGEKTRVNLATLLIQSPELLLLDEPTNNLDTASLQWLESWLKDFPGAILAASHDRQFLNNLMTVIFEIDEHSHELKEYSGNYDDYKAAKETERSQWEEDYRNQQDEINELKRRIKSAHSQKTWRSNPVRDHDKFVRYFKGQRSEVAVSRSIRDAEERLKRIQDEPVPKPPRPMRFKAGFRSQDIKSSEVVRATGLSKSYGNRQILSDVNLILRYSSRVIISGPNGTGKTTLLNILTGKDNAETGQVKYAPSVRTGYLPQEPDLTDGEKTVMEYYSEGLTGYEEDFVFGLVTCGLFRYDELKKKVRQLSLGQVRKLQIARLIAQEPNMLVLDEPTNHISLDVLESFEAAIAEFQGPVLAVSHDRRFICQFGGEVWELEGGKLVEGGKVIQ